MKKSKFMNNVKMTIVCGILATTVSFGASASAFSDLKGDPAESKINSLQSEGIISGVTSDKFAPKSNVTFAQGVQFIIQGLKLSPKPSAGKEAVSDYFTHVNDKAWYASAFLTAKQHGLPLDKNVNPNATISRAQFTHLMAEALKTKGDFAVTEMYFNISDGGTLSDEVMNNLQMLLNTRLLNLDKNSKFRPNDPVTRSEAVVWIYDAAEFAKNIKAPDDNIDVPSYSNEAEVTVSQAAIGVNKVTLTVTNLPNSGYGLSIDKIEFGKDKTATIYFSFTNPQPDKMYLQVISTASAVTYLPEGYSAIVKSSLSSKISFPTIK